jgi:hypothetical protein
MDVLYANGVQRQGLVFQPLERLDRFSGFFGGSARE